jgi:beta-xylosidase
MRHQLLLVMILLTSCALNAQDVDFSRIPVLQGESINDQNGLPVNAHGAGVLFHNGMYYLYGEIKLGKTWLVPGQNWEDYRVPAGGISCYSSKDLVSWKYEGIALAPTLNNDQSDIDTGRVIERPKVIYNAATKQFVMWMHIDTKDYAYARAGVAVSNSPAGPFVYQRSVRPNGQMARDMTLFKDDDGKAYLIFSSENNATMQVCLLSPDYLSPTTTYSRILVNQSREAPALFRHKNKYFLITSGCTGWSPNAASYAVADSPLGPWKAV